MDISAREQLCKLLYDRAEDLIGLFAARVERTALAVNLRNGLHGRLGMAGHIYFRDHLYMSCRRIFHNFTDIVLSVELCRRISVTIAADGTCLAQLRIGLYLDAPALTVGKMPVKAVEFVSCHHVKKLLDLLLAEEMSCLVKHESAPLESRLVLDGHAVHHIGGRKLLQCLFGIETPRRRRRADDYASVPYLKFVGLFRHALDFPIHDVFKVRLVEDPVRRLHALRLGDNPSGQKNQD